MMALARPALIFLKDISLGLGGGRHENVPVVVMSEDCQCQSVIFILLNDMNGLKKKRAVAFSQ